MVGLKCVEAELFLEALLREYVEDGLVIVDQLGLYHQPVLIVEQKDLTRMDLYELDGTVSC
jgi:hypothetical protein